MQQIEKLKFLLYAFKYFVRHEKVLNVYINHIHLPIQFHLKQEKFFPNVHVYQCKVKRSNLSRNGLLQCYFKGLVLKMY